MSVLAKKHVLIVGDESSQVHDIATALKREGAVVQQVNCNDFEPDSLKKDKIDVVFLNHLHEQNHCNIFLKQASERRDMKVLPVFALVHNDKSEIEQVLAYGAADYFTPSETVSSILNKVRIVLGDSVNSANNIVIDIGDSSVPDTKSGVKILIVEDDPLLSNLLSIRLERASLPYRMNKNGSNIEKDLNEFGPDVVLLDLMLPGCSGFEVLEQIRKHKEMGNIPVYIFSNRDSADDKARAAELGASGFYVKAMTDLSDLIKNVTQAVAKN